MNERLSAFVDDELSTIEERRLLEDLGRDPALRATWERYHVIRAALRRELEHVAPTGLCAAVASAIAGDPKRSARRTVAANLGKALGGLAIAATVAAMAILYFPAAPTPERQPLAAAKPATPVGTVATRAPAPTNPLHAYVVEHNEFAPTAGMGNMLPYVRTVGHDSSR